MSSKNQIDKAGQFLSKNLLDSTENYQEIENIFDNFRKQHLKPLSSTTLELQQWLQQADLKYYIAQRLKRKPQILRKLTRLGTRLTQLQDIGGSRIVVESNSDVDSVVNFLEEKVRQQGTINLIRKTDYREKGRDDSGYRAVHLILERGELKLELQIRSRIQHYWAELIERTSVIYGHYIKELQGDPYVINYFKRLSDLFYEIESGRTPHISLKLEVEQLRNEAKYIIESADSMKILDSHVNEGIVKTLIDKEKRLGGPGLNNWIFIFNWNQGAFISWDVVSLEPDEAIRSYVDYEKAFPAEDGFEVVLVGSSDVATVRETHSHYFGLKQNSSVLETLDESIVGFSNQMDIDIGARQILSRLVRKRFWGKKTISIDTVKNHFCQDVLTFESSLQTLIDKGLVYPPSSTKGIALNIKKKQEVEKYL